MKQSIEKEFAKGVEIKCCYCGIECHVLDGSMEEDENIAFVTVCDKCGELTYFPLHELIWDDSEKPPCLICRGGGCHVCQPKTFVGKGLRRWF